ncbi:MAG: Bug family tripartite tricarboxylate transporter substrate binding protein, partial [Dongiaceae bacterium]
IALGRSNAGKLSFATLGVGSSPHLSAAAFNRAAGIDALHVPFKDQGQMVNAVASGEVDYMFISATTAAPATKAGRARLLAYGARQRLATHPEVPTLDEAAGISVETGGWVGVFAPRGTPREVVAKLNADITGVLRQKDVDNRIRSLGFVPMPTSSEEFAAMVARKRQTVGELVKSTGIRLE